MHKRLGSTKFRKLLIGSALVLGILPSLILSADRKRESDRVETVNFEPGRRVLFPVTVNGQKCQLFVNISRAESTVDVSLREHLGKPIKKAGNVAGAADGEQFEMPEIRVGEKRRDEIIGARTISVTDFSRGKLTWDREGDGYLGLDFFKSKVLRLDFEKGLAQIKSAASGTGGTVEELRWRQGVPHILAGVPDEGFKSFQFSLADFNLQFNADLYNRLVSKGHIKDMSGTDATGKMPVRFGILDSFEIGSYRFSNQLILQTGENLIGQRFLAHFNLEFDFPSSEVRLQPNSHFQEPSWYNRAGAMLVPRSDRCVVMVFDSNAAAAKSGLRSEDEILEVNGRNIHDVTVEAVARVLSNPGGKVRMKIKREGAVKDVVVQLSNEPDPFPNLPQMIDTTSVPEFLK